MKFIPIKSIPYLSFVSTSLLAGAVLLASGPNPALAQSVNVVQTTPDQTNLLTPQTPLAFAPGAGSQLAINIDDTVRYQTLEGVGASFTDTAAYLVWNKLTPAQRQQLMSDLFGPTGIHLSFLRQPMGASDLALSSYTYDDVAPGNTDPTLSQFSIAHDQAYILPTLRQALATNPQIKVEALPWSPPAWMKSSDSLNAGTLNPAYFPALATYFKKFVKAYESNGVPINYVAVQNEPLNENYGYPTMFMNSRDEATFIADYLGPTLSSMQTADRAGRSPANTIPGILGYEHNWDNPKYPEDLLSNRRTRSFLAGVSFHCYGGNAADAQNAIHDLDPGTPIFYTECSGGSWAPNFAQNLANGVDGQMIQVLRNWGKTVTMWNMALDQNGGPTVENGCRTCRGVVTVDTSTTPATVTPNVEYYILGHLSKFVVPGAYRIASNTFGSSSIDNVAFKNPDGSIAVVVFNGASTPSQFSMNWQGKTVSYNLAAGAVATLTWAGHKGDPFDVTAGPPAQTIAPGQSTLFEVNVDQYAAGTAPVKLSVQGLPAGAFAALDPISFTNEWILPIFSEPSVHPGSFPLTVTGSEGGIQRSSTVQLNIGQPETPFEGTPWTLPGLVQAENFDQGGNYIGYFNLDTADYGGATYRDPATVGVEPSSDTAGSFGAATSPAGGYDVGYTKEGEWLRYTVNVTQPGIYNLGARVANYGTGGYFHVSFDGQNATGTLLVPNTGWWENFVTLVSPAFRLEPGKHTMQVTLDSNGPSGGMGNFNWFAVEPIPVGTPFPAAAPTIPGTIQVENFDAGGKGVGYWTGATSNSGGAIYRPGEAISIETCSDAGGGYDVGNLNPGDWLNYTVDIAAARKYTLNARVAIAVGGGVFHLAVDGRRVTPPISVPETGGWQTWQTLTVPNVDLPAGTHTLQLVIDSGGFYNTVGNLNWISLQ